MSRFASSHAGPGTLESLHGYGGAGTLAALTRFGSDDPFFIVAFVVAGFLGDFGLSGTVAPTMNSHPKTEPSPRVPLVAQNPKAVVPSTALHLVPRRAGIDARPLRSMCHRCRCRTSC